MSSQTEGVLESAELSDVAIYIHWPWCKAKCPYCDFNSHESAIQEEAYVGALLNELSAYREARLIGGVEMAPFQPSTRRVSSVFFGGGTPSLIPAREFAKIIDSCRSLGVFDDTTEVSVECNPTSFDDARPALGFFEDLKAAGVTRVSIGIQGLNNDWLRFLGRTHRVEEALATLDAAQRVFDNVNADVIYGLPEQSLEAWLGQLHQLSQRGLAHISAYQLTIEKNTRFYKDVKNALWAPISGDAEADFFDGTRSSLRACGYDNYEISNFAKPGQACRHNRHVWRYGDYIGVGAGAHGRLTGTNGTVVATTVMRQPDSYLKLMQIGKQAFSGATRLDTAEALQEAFFSGLRLAEGVHVAHCQKRFGMPVYEAAINRRETSVLLEAGLLEWAGSHLRLTDYGWPRLNSILERMLTPLRLANAVAPPLPPVAIHASTAYTKAYTVTIE